MNTRPRQRLITPPAARRLGSVVSGDAHVCACVLRGEPRDHVQCDAPRFCGIPSKGNIERQLIVPEEDAALTSIGSRECDESLHLARGPNFEFHARSIGAGVIRLRGSPRTPRFRSGLRSSPPRASLCPPLDGSDRRLLAEQGRSSSGSPRRGHAGRRSPSLVDSHSAIAQCKR
ncbi:MAG: hypothetical protein V7645_2125 [Actinomycetota bacterium]